jgi:hypothetical protein
VALLDEARARHGVTGAKGDSWKLAHVDLESSHAACVLWFSLSLSGALRPHCLAQVPQANRPCDAPCVRSHGSGHRPQQPQPRRQLGRQGEPRRADCGRRVREGEREREWEWAKCEPRGFSCWIESCRAFNTLRSRKGRRNLTYSQWYSTALYSVGRKPVTGTRGWSAYLTFAEVATDSCH